MQISKFTNLAKYGGVYYSYVFSAEIASEIFSKYLDKNSSSFNPSLYVKKALAVEGNLDTRKIIKNLQIKV